MKTQQIPKGDWNSSQDVKIFFMGKEEGTITKNDALAKITEATKKGLKIELGYDSQGTNFLKVE